MKGDNKPFPRRFDKYAAVARGEQGQRAVKIAGPKNSRADALLRRFTFDDKSEDQEPGN